MNAETQNVNNLFSGTQTYRVRLYQRHYVWNESDWEELWGDIKEKSDLRLKDESSRKEHFTGTIIIQPDGGNIELLDGQQRLITFQIILCAIRDIWIVFDNTETAERVHRLIENERFDESEPTGRYKLLPREGSDRETFLSIVEKKMVLNAAESIDGGGERIQEGYWYFRSAIASYVATDYDKLNNLYRAIINDFRVIQIEVASGDEYTRIFELIDGRNKGLSAFDLLRNNLFLRVGTGKVRDELYRKYWGPFERYWFSSKDEIYAFWAHCFVAHFLRAKLGIWIPYPSIPAYRQLDNRLFDVYQTYRRELSEKLNLDQDNFQFVEHEFQELNRYAQVSEEIRDSDSEIGTRLGIYYVRDGVGGLSGYVSSRFRGALIQFILYIKNELRVSDNLLTSVVNFMESLIVQFVLCTGESVDIPEYPSFEFDIFNASEDHLDATFSAYLSIFYYLKKDLLSNVLDINMMRNNLSSEAVDKFREFEVFPPRVVEKALRDYCQDEVPGEYTDRESYSFARGNWGSLICYILYEIELMIAKERGITETDFSEMLDDLDFRYGQLATRLLKHYPRNIGNLTVCPSLWDVNDGWDVKEIVEREEKLIEYFNKRWPSIEDCLDKMIQSAKCELIGTDEGIKELSQIVVHDTHIEGIDRNDNQRVVLDKDNILFTCAAAAWSRLKPYIQEDEALKGQTLGAIQLNDGMLRFAWYISSDVVAVTRSGHVLRGKIKEPRDFNEDAINMTINKQSVIVFKQGLYEFETMKPCKAQIINFIQDPQDLHHGILEVSEQPEDRYYKGFTELFGEDPREINVHISQVPNKDFHSLQPGQKIAFNIAQTENGLYARNITRSGAFYEKEPNLIQTYEGTRELSQIVVHNTHIEGIDCKDNQQVVLDQSSILFVCPATVWSILKPYIQEDTAVKEHALGPIQSPAEKLQVNDWILKSARLDDSDVVAVTRSGHVLRGNVEHFDEDVICMEISWEWVNINVIVFKQGLHQFETMKRYKAQVSNFIQDPQNEHYRILDFSSEKPEDDNELFTRLFGEEPGRIYVHISQVPNADFHLLQPGQKIDFNIAQTEKGLYARNISLLDPEEVAEMPPRRSRRRRDRRRRRPSRLSGL